MKMLLYKQYLINLIWSKKKEKKRKKEGIRILLNIKKVLKKFINLQSQPLSSFLKKRERSIDGKRVRLRSF